MQRQGMQILNAVLKGLGSVCLFVAMLLICADVALRYLLNAPISGTLELSELVPVIVTYCFFTFTAMEERHIRTTFAVDRLPERFRPPIGLLAQVLMLIFLALLIWRTAVEGYGSWQIREISQGLIAVPRYPVKVLIPVALSVGWLYYVGQLVSGIRETRA